jgi:outer membrane receptor for Fe3+-dicitrate
VGGTNAAGLGGALLYSGTHGSGWRAGNDKTDIDDLLLKGSYRLTGQDNLSASLHHFEGKGRMPGGLTTAQYAADPSRARAATTSSPAAAPTARSSTPTTTAATTSKCWPITWIPSAAATSSRKAAASAA